MLGIRQQKAHGCDGQKKYLTLLYHAVLGQTEVKVQRNEPNSIHVFTKLKSQSVIKSWHWEERLRKGNGRETDRTLERSVLSSMVENRFMNTREENS